CVCVCVCVLLTVSLLLLLSPLQRLYFGVDGVVVVAAVTSSGCTSVLTVLLLLLLSPLQQLYFSVDGVVVVAAVTSSGCTSVLTVLLFLSEDCIQCSGEDYRGRASTTENGFTCQRWDSQKPHNHGYNPGFLEENYCRNPDGDPRPWCFTTSSSKRWDFCSIPRCSSEPPTIVPELSCITGEGGAYRGTIAVTESGKTCQSWSAQSPHKHNRTPDNYPCKGLENNYCRNPDNERMPWCYTTDPETRWEENSGNEILNSEVRRVSADEPVIPPDEDDCYHGNGADYHGITSETISGKKCQMWNSMTPHRHNKTPENFPLRNHCRNPDGDRSPWCYTMDPKVRWEYCSLEKCSVRLTHQ
uniref:Kringle domain-containing protein n=1 Tax=Salarias fasciatus TaxID=181472 RepID=A0A672HQJ7_SALFA